MSKIVLLADLHVHPFQEHATLIDGVSSRLLDTIYPFKAVRKRCLEKDISCVIVAGDWFHKRGVVNTLPYNLVVKELALFKKKNIRVIAVSGNHDQADRAGLVDAVEALSMAELVEGVSPSEGHKTFWHDGFPVHAFSYCDDRDIFQRRLDENDKDGERGLGVFHHGFSGARVGTHLEYEVKEPISAKKRLADRGYRAIVSGHYHSKQKIKGLDNGHYIGSPSEFTRATRDDLHVKGYEIYDSDSNEFESVPLGLPKFMKADLAEVTFDGTLEDGNFVDVEWGGDYPGGAEKLEADLREAGAKGVKLIQKKVVTGTSRPENVSQLPTEALAAWLEVRENEIKTLGLGKEELYQIGSELLHKVSETE